MDKATAPLKQVESGVKKIEKAAKGSNKAMLGLGLGLTFFMFGVKMQLDRMLRSMFNIFKQAEGETGILIQKFNGLKASLAAISIAFFDAFFQSPFFDAIIALVSTLADKFLDLGTSTKQWLATSLFTFSGIIFGLSLVGQALLAIFVLSNLNPIGRTLLIIVLALGALVISFITARDDLEKVMDNMKTDWDLFKGEFGKGATLFEDLPAIITRAKILFIDFALWVGSLPIIGLFQPQAVTESFIQERDSLLRSLIPTSGTGLEAVGGFANIPEAVIAASDNIAKQFEELPDKLIIGFTKSPMPIMDEDGLKIIPLGESLQIFDPDTQKQIDKLEEQRQSALASATDQLTKLNDLVIAVNNIELSPQITVNVTGSESSTTS